MKVAIVCPYDWSVSGGVKTHIIGLSASLRNNGVEVEILAPSSSPESDIFRVGKPIPIKFNGSVARICFSPSAKRRLDRRLGLGDIDLLHLHEPLIPSVCLLALMQKTLPAIATFHASAERSVAYSIAQPVLKKYFNRLREKVVVSNPAESLIAKHFPGQFSRVPNGVEAKRYADASADSELDRHRPFVLFLGRPEPRKGLAVAIEAMAKVRQHHDVRFVAVGPTQEQVPDWAVGIGQVPSDRLPGIYKAASVFVAPSLSGESFGIVLAEAMAAGTPVVCSNLPGYVEAAEGACLHVPVGDPAETAVAIVRALQSPDELVQRGLARATSLDWDNLVPKIIALYERALS